MESDSVGRKKEFDGKLVSIGAKVTEKQMKKIDDLAAKLGMESRSELFRAALADYLHKHTENIGYSDSITIEGESHEQVQVNTCLAYKELEISLNNAITELKHLGECSRLDALVPCSDAGYPKGEVVNDN